MAEYFYTDERGEVRGPVPFKKLHAMAAFGSVPADARVLEVAEPAGAPPPWPTSGAPWRPIAEVLPPDTLPTPAQKRTPDSAGAGGRPSPLAACSLLLGVGVFVLGGFAPACLAGPAGVGAVVCGHLAFIGKRRASLTWGMKAAAIIGLVLGYLGILIGVGGVFTLLAASLPKP